MCIYLPAYVLVCLSAPLSACLSMSRSHCIYSIFSCYVLLCLFVIPSLCLCYLTLLTRNDNLFLLKHLVPACTVLLCGSQAQKRVKPQSHVAEEEDCKIIRRIQTNYVIRLMRQRSHYAIRYINMFYLLHGVSSFTRINPSPQSPETTIRKKNFHLQLAMKCTTHVLLSKMTP